MIQTRHRPLNDDVRHAANVVLADGGVAAAADTDCCYCAEFAGHKTAFHRLYGALESRAVVETPNFVVMPSLGQLIRGHMLLVPRQHVTSFGQLDSAEREEAGRLYARMRRELGERYSPVVCFEHGSPAGARAGGCGIVHAHVHVVPLEHRDSHLPRAVGDGWRVSSGSSWLEDAARLARRGGGYLMWHAPGEAPHLELVDQVTSQSLRRHVAALLGNENWDWRDAGPQRELLETIRDCGRAVIAAAPRP